MEFTRKNNIQEFNNSRDQIQTGLNQRITIPSNMNFPINNSHNPLMDRAVTTNNYNQPVQTNMQSQYEFERLNIMDIPKQNIFIDNKPIDTRRQRYDITKQTDDIFIKNQQGTLYNYIEHKPTTTRLYENKHITGINFDLLPHRRLNIPKNKI